MVLVIWTTLSAAAERDSFCLAQQASPLVLNTDQENRQDAQRQGASISAEAQSAIALLESRDPYLQQKGFLQLESLREPETAAVVRRYLTHREPQTRACCVRALAAIEGPKAVPVLLDRLKHDRSPRVRLAACLALEPLKDPRAVPGLIERLRDRHPEVRMAAVDIVSRIDDRQARQAVLTRWRRERHRDVRRVLEEAMKRFASPS